MGENTITRRRLQIGLLVSHLDENFDTSVCEGAMIAAGEADVNLVIFPGRYIDAVYADKLRTEYEYQYNTVFDLPRYNKFDALLILLGTVGSHLDKAHQLEFLQKYTDTPVITIAAEVEGYPCISINNKAGMDEVIQHLISEHGCKKIGYVSGPVTNIDANERLQVYRDVLERNKIPFDENLVAYGNFSKYVTNIVGDLLDRCPGLDAIVFANDQMALAGYQAMEERGLRPGKDILITGFDDDPIAQDLTPPLTTVKADPVELGYTSLMEAVNYINNGSLENGVIPSAMVCRNSCGCQGNPRLRSLSLDCHSDSPEEFSRQIAAVLFSSYSSNENENPLQEAFADLILSLSTYATPEHIHDTQLREALLDQVDTLTNEQFFSIIHIDNLYAIVEHIHQVFLERLTNQDDYFLLSQLFIQIYKIIAQRNATYCKVKLDDSYFFTWQTNAITRDMLVFESYDDQSYFSVVDKLCRLHMTSSYLYSYEPAIINRKNDKWALPDHVYLKSYHSDSEAVLLPHDQQIIPQDQLFSNPYLPKDRRYTLVVSPLFSNEEQYGLLMCEIQHEYFNYIQSVTSQLCAALKIIALMRQQARTQRQLQQSLIEIKENNELLSNISRQDDLTGCLNRRGFFEEVRKKLRAEENEGANAIMVFADLDSLKTINDRFGHEEGDFAIRGAAQILRESFGENEIVGRIGGDEFVVCAFLKEPVTIPALREHVDAVSRRFNELYGADKPYIVHTSVGAYPFTCTGTVEISQLLSHADTLLYEQKKHKKSILKADR